MNEKTLSRRAVVAGVSLLLAGCSGTNRSIRFASHPDLVRQEVPYGAPYRTGTVVVNIRERRLYLVQSGSRALRYAVGVGRAEVRNFQGSAVIGRKEVWPSWTPTANMMRAMPSIGPMLVACQADFKIRSGRGPFISTVTARIPISACMGLTNQILSARRRRAAASDLSTKI